MLAFCDSDCCPEPDWLEHGLAALAACDIVAGKVRFEVPTRPTIWSLVTVDHYLDQRRTAHIGVAATANMFVARTVFDRVGAFDESLPSGGDWDFVRRATAAGARLTYAPQAMVRHPTLDNAHTLLGKVWRVNRWSEARRARAGIPLYEGRGGLVASLVPFLGMVLERRRSRRALAGLELERLTELGITVSLRQRILGIAAVYILVAPTVRLAQVYARLAARVAGGHRPSSIPELGPSR